MKKPEFDPSKFMTSMVDKKLPEKTGGKADGKGTFKEDGSVPKPDVAPKKPAPKQAEIKAGKKGTAPKGDKAYKPDKNAATDQDNNKLLKTSLDALKNKAPYSKAELAKELGIIKSKVKGVSLPFVQAGEKWIVTPGGGGKKKSVGKIELAMKKTEGKNIKLTAPFDMNGEGHTIYAEIQNGKLIVEMASSQRDQLRTLISKAKTQTKNPKAIKRLGDVYAKLEKAQWEVDHLISDKTEDAKIFALVDKITKDAAENLKGIGKEFGIENLRVIPHKSMYVEASVSGYQIKSQYRSIIRKTFYQNSYEPATVEWKKNLVAAKTDPLNTKNFIDSQGRSEPKSTATIDHQPKVVEHWESLGGKNVTQSARKTWYSDHKSGRLDIIAKKWNSSDGAQAKNMGYNYTPDNIGTGFLGPGE
jgi:hypothetical protein